MELTLTEFVITVLIASGALVLLLVMISRVVRVHRESQSAAKRVICRLCLHAFESPESEKVVLCPRCGAASERGRSRRLG